MDKKSKKVKTKKYGILSNAGFILKEQWKYKKSYLFAVVLLIPCEVLLSLITAYLPAAVTGCAENHDNPSKMLITVGVISLGIVIITAIQKCLEVYKYKLQNYTKNIHYRNLLINKIMDMDYNNYIYTETRTKRERANIAVTRWLGGVGAFIELNRQFLTNLFGFGAFAAIITACNPWFVLILIISYIITALFWLLYQKYKDSMKDEVASTKLKLNYLTYKTKDLTNAKDIRIYDMTGFIMEKIELLISDLKRLDTKMNNVRFGIISIEELVKAAISLGAYIYLIKLKLDPAINMSIKDFLWNFTAITGFSSWLGKLVNSAIEVVECNRYVDDLRNFLDIPDTMNRQPGKILPAENELPCSIDIENLSFTYSGAKTPTLNNISLHINPGEKIALVGVNGAGKTTLVKVISGLFKPTKGQIKINGIDSTEFNRDKYYKLFTAIFQDMSVLPVSIAENIALCEKEKINTNRLKDCMIKADILEKIESLPEKENTMLVKEVNKKAIDLSGGELQKLLLARALYKDAPVIILDEPTSALDPVAENKLYLKYNELTKDKTSIYISHRLSSTRFCDKIVLLDDAGIEEIGTHDELIAKKGKYAEMFNAQSKYYRE